MNQKPDLQSGRVEDDFNQPLTPMKGTSYRRLSTALPMALVSILVVFGVAFGATVVRPMIVGPNPSATPVDVGDDDPDVTPSPEITEAPPSEAPATEAPTPPKVDDPAPGNNMTLTAKLSGLKVVLTWSAYTGEDFAYYKIVRSTDKDASWPLDSDDRLLTAYSEQDKLTFTDAAPTGKTWFWQVFAVKATDDGYKVLDSTNVASVAIPKPTPRPTTNCGIRMSAKLVGTTAKISWSKFTCKAFDAYVVVKTQNKAKLAAARPQDQDGVYIMYEGDGNSTAYGMPGGTWYVQVLAVQDPANACNGWTVVGRSNIWKVTVSAPTEG